MDPSDFQKYDPPREDHKQQVLKPERHLKVVAGIFIGGLVVLLVMLFIGLVVL